MKNAKRQWRPKAYSMEPWWRLEMRGLLAGLLTPYQNNQIIYGLSLTTCFVHTPASWRRNIPWQGDGHKEAGQNDGESETRRMHVVAAHAAADVCGLSVCKSTLFASLFEIRFSTPTSSITLTKTLWTNIATIACDDLRLRIRANAMAMHYAAGKCARERWLVQYLDILVILRYA